jgi:hypothetical protein
MDNERWLVCGGRTFGRVIAPDSPSDVERAAREAALLTDQLDVLVNHFGAPSVVITGGAPGADTLADEWRVRRGYPGQVFKADWDALGRRAGIVRNTQMLTVLRVIKSAPKRVIAFKGTEGTLNMIQQAHAAGIAVSKVGW